MDQAAKQQIVERIKQANNILVTVSANPSVDQLAAAIGLTLFLNKLEKHATAVFSGQVPSTIEFLQPEKTLEPNTDSLRDFIISLDKAKADKLRYKVEDQLVRIFITPYRTSLSEKDLVFSEGDFNVEVVLALGVKDPNDLDEAIKAHGKILHDATVVAVNCGQQKVPDIGQINWQDPGASSLCEMLVSVSESFATGLIDNQIATAFLTGIVAETNRFSNNKTTPKVMTMSAQLMAAGANQQLIVSKLEPPRSPGQPPAPRQPKTPTPSPAEPGVLIIPHADTKPQDVPYEVIKSDEIHIDEHGNIKDEQATKAQVAVPPMPPAVAIPEPPEPGPSLGVAQAPEIKKNEVQVPKEPIAQEKPAVAEQPKVLSEEKPQYEDLLTMPEAMAPAPPPQNTTITLEGTPLPAQIPATAPIPPARITTPTLSLPTGDQPQAQEPAPAHHALLNPNEQPPVINSPLSADTQMGALDPFKEMAQETPSGANNLMLSHIPTVQPPSTSNLLDDARSAVAQAAPTSQTQAPMVQIPQNPVITPQTQPQSAPNAAPNQAEAPKLPPPPPVPPPLKLDSGAIIPSYPPPGVGPAPSSSAL